VTVRADLLARGQVLRLTLNAPPGNLLDGELSQALARALDAAPAPDCKLILLRAHGPHFSVGSRLDSAAALARFHNVLYRLIDLGVPTAAVVPGRCYGAALDLVAFCNFVFAARGTSFGRPEVRGGVIPAPASLILGLKLGPRRAGDLLLGGVLDCREAYRRGLVTAWAHAPGDLGALARTWIERHILLRTASSLKRANRIARLGFHARLRAELPTLERLYVAGCLGPAESTAQPPRPVRAMA
jgi:enoyl-CoA hydratase/carnithine racemase